MCASGTTAAENLSKAAATATAVIDAWMHSPGHRSNLLDPALTQIGVGCVRDGESMLCSQVFLGPLPTAVVAAAHCLARTLTRS